jgi:hypothetical protein
MPSTYTPIPYEELNDFLHERYFIQIPTPYQERVYSREDYCGKMLVRIQVFSSVTKQRQIAREVGKDAIRIIMKGKDADGNEHILNLPKRCYRTTNWRSKLNAALADWQRWIRYKCSTCNTPLTYIYPDRKGPMHCSYCKAGL